jgi:hypothetical protein
MSVPSKGEQLKKDGNAAYVKGALPEAHAKYSECLESPDASETCRCLAYSNRCDIPRLTRSACGCKNLTSARKANGAGTQSMGSLMPRRIFMDGGDSAGVCSCFSK